MSSDAETPGWELIWAWVSREYSVGEVDSLWLRTRWCLPGPPMERSLWFLKWLRICMSEIIRHLKGLKGPAVFISSRFRQIADI